jgi:hypothetical protein
LCPTRARRQTRHFLVYHERHTLPAPLMYTCACTRHTYAT